MPELPEVETVVRQLALHLPGRRIDKVTVHYPDLLKEPPRDFVHGLQGSAFGSVERRGKNIVLELHPPSILVVNLGMTGQLLVDPPESGVDQDRPPNHPGVDFRLSPRRRLLYADTRRFGSLRRFTPSQWAEESLRLGPEPLDSGLTARAFHQRLLRSRSPIRSWMLDQTRIAGVGNIYASEALFRSGIHPRRQARSLNPEEASRLLRGLRRVLREAILARGTTLRDYRTASGESGAFGPSLRVYGREGEACLKCKALVRRDVFGNRSSFYCPRCQREA